MFPLIEADTNPVFVFACTALVIEELSWYPDPKPECGDTWMTRVLTYWAHPDTKEEYATVQLVKKLTERSI